MNNSYKHYVLSFKEWLKIVGYSDATVTNYPNMLQDCLMWLEQQGVNELSQVSAEHTAGFIEYNKTRPHRRREGSISSGHVNRYIDLIKVFNQYLQKVEGFELPINVLRLPEDEIPVRIILSIEEIHKLYQATDETPFGIRDRAMLAVHYGCGLRKSEGVRLDVSDVLAERKLLHVRKAKNNYERYVPVTTGNLRYIEQYISHARNLLLPDKAVEQEPSLFINMHGYRMGGGQFLKRLKDLCVKAGISKNAGIHSLRHSIATHLLQQGMELENIALFLGHRCLDSTQIYTQLVNEL